MTAPSSRTGATDREVEAECWCPDETPAGYRPVIAGCPTHDYEGEPHPLLLSALAGGQEAAHEVEAVAVAIAASDGHDWERLGPGHPLRADYRRNARAARAALLAKQPGGGR